MSRLKNSDKGVIILSEDLSTATLYFKSKEAIDHLVERLDGMGVALENPREVGDHWIVDVMNYRTLSENAREVIIARCGTYDELLTANGGDKRPSEEKVLQALENVTLGKGRVF